MKIKALVLSAAVTATATTIALAAPTNTVGLNEQGNPIPAYASFLALYNTSGGDNTPSKSARVSQVLREHLDRDDSSVARRA